MPESSTTWESDREGPASVEGRKGERQSERGLRDREGRRRVRHRETAGRGVLRGGRRRIWKRTTRPGGCGCGCCAREKDERGGPFSGSESPRQKVLGRRAGGKELGNKKIGGGRRRAEGRGGGERERDGAKGERDEASRSWIEDDERDKEERSGEERGERVNLEVAAERVFIIRTDQGTQRPGLPLMMLYSRLARSLVLV